MSTTPSPEALRKQARELAFQLSHVAGTYIVPGWDGYKVAVLLEHLAALAARGTPQVLDGDERAELDRLRVLVHSPHTDKWMEAVNLEAAHQQERWGSEHDAGKIAEDWIFLAGHLMGKASVAFKTGDRAKGLHHIVSSSAVMLNWHRNVMGHNTSMRPGIAGTSPEAAAAKLSEAALASQGAAPAIAYRGPARFTAEEIAAGNVGIRWVTETHVGGRPTEHDVYQYLAARGADAHCSCEKCAAKRAAPTGAGDAEPDDGALPATLLPVHKEWYTLCERAPHAHKITISGALAEAIVRTVVAAPQQPAEAAPGEIDALRADAERYREFIGCGLPITFLGTDYRSKSELDAAIDAALANNKKGG